MPKILIIDTYYPDYLRSLPKIHPGSLYTVELNRVLGLGFGTADFYSRNLRKLGWEAVDVIANYFDLQMLWQQCNGKWTGYGREQANVLAQIEAAKPDVVFMQDLSFFDPDVLTSISSRYFLAGQCSCPMPRFDRVSKFHLLFTSFPHYVDIFKSVGIKSEYLPLAFEPRMAPPEGERDLDISFVGGVGKQSHWRAGTDVLEFIAKEFGDRFHWYGYGLTNLDSGSPLRKCFRGEAWGNKMYEVYGRSKIVINRHGEVAAGFANNLRMFEATGCGSLLLTESARNLSKLFPDNSVVGYGSDLSLPEVLNFYLSDDQARKRIAENGRDWTLNHHTYSDRMKIVANVLENRLRKTA